MLLTEFDEEKDWAIIAKGFEEIGFDKGIAFFTHHLSLNTYHEKRLWKIQSHFLFNLQN